MCAPVIWKSIMYIIGPRNPITKYINNRNTCTQVPKKVNKNVYRRVICIKPRNDLNLYHSRIKEQHIHITVPHDSESEGLSLHARTRASLAEFSERRGTKEHIPYDSIYTKTHAT